MPSDVSQRSRPSALTTIDSTSMTAMLVPTRSRTRFMNCVSPLTVSRGGGLYGFQDRARAFLCDDIRPRVRVPRRNAREHRRIDHAQAFEAAHAQLIVAYCHRVVAHLAGADRVEDCGPQLACRSFQICILFDRETRPVLLRLILG